MECVNFLNCYMFLLCFILLDGLIMVKEIKIKYGTCIYYVKVVYREVSCFLFILGKRNNYGGFRKYRKSFCVYDEWRKYW